MNTGKKSGFQEDKGIIEYLIQKNMDFFLLNQDTPDNPQKGKTQSWLFGHFLNCP